MAASLKQDEVEVELRSPDRRRKLAVVNKNGLTSLEIEEYKEVFEVAKPKLSVYMCVCFWGGGGDTCKISPCCPVAEINITAWCPKCRFYMLPRMTGRVPVMRGSI